MEDFYYAGGLPVVIKEIGKHIHKQALTVNGRTIWENVKDAVNYNPAVITPLAKPFKPIGGIAVLRGNLAPKGAVLSHPPRRRGSCSTRAAVVFDNIGPAPPDRQSKLDVDDVACWCSERGRATRDFRK
jgi:dihydroxy-acid dehydratase